jgi:hypothetical protein
VTSTPGVAITVADVRFWYGLIDPYCGCGRDYSLWFGYPSGGVIYNVTERRLIRYIKWVQANSRFQVDAYRIFVTGASMGSASMHLSSHYPTVFAAAFSSIGWVDTETGGLGDRDSTLPVNSSTGPRLADWQSLRWVAERSAVPLPPMIHTYGSDDNMLSMTNYPATLQALETYKHFQISKWQPTGHNQFGIVGVDMYRFRRNEAYPVFSNASSSTPFGGTGGQRNEFLTWSSVQDTATQFSVVLQSRNSAEASADVTIRNTQAFSFTPNQAVSWENRAVSDNSLLQSGTVTVGSNGLATIRVRILPSAGSRLSLTR